MAEWFLLGGAIAAASSWIHRKIEKRKIKKRHRQWLQEEAGAGRLAIGDGATMVQGISGPGYDSVQYYAALDHMSTTRQLTDGSVDSGADGHRYVVSEPPDVHAASSAGAHLRALQLQQQQAGERSGQLQLPGPPPMLALPDVTDAEPTFLGASSRQASLSPTKVGGVAASSSGFDDAYRYAYGHVSDGAAGGGGRAGMAAGEATGAHGHAYGSQQQSGGHGLAANEHLNQQRRMSASSTSHYSTHRVTHGDVSPRDASDFDSAALAIVPVQASGELHGYPSQVLGRQAGESYTQYGADTAGVGSMVGGGFDAGSVPLNMMAATRSGGGSSGYGSAQDRPRAGTMPASSMYVYRVSPGRRPLSSDVPTSSAAAGSGSHTLEQQYASRFNTVNTQTTFTDHAISQHQYHGRRHTVSGDPVVMSQAIAYASAQQAGYLPAHANDHAAHQRLVDGGGNDRSRSVITSPTTGRIVVGRGDRLTAHEAPLLEFGGAGPGAAQPEFEDPITPSVFGGQIPSTTVHRSDAAMATDHESAASSFDAYHGHGSQRDAAAMRVYPVASVALSPSMSGLRHRHNAHPHEYTHDGHGLGGVVDGDHGDSGYRVHSSSLSGGGHGERVSRHMAATESQARAEVQIQQRRHHQHRSDGSVASHAAVFPSVAGDHIGLFSTAVDVGQAGPPPGYL